MHASPVVVVVTFFSGANALLSLASLLTSRAHLMNIMLKTVLALLDSVERGRR
jgi:hypothetical protein